LNITGKQPESWPKNQRCEKCNVGLVLEKQASPAS
jgi:hypothetical protein